MRASTGNTLALVVSLGFALLAIGLFSLSYVRQLATHQEQNTAIEAAALVASKDLSRVIISDPVFGYVGLVDAAPVGTATAAPDLYGLPVRSINSILATIRLDMIIADQIGNETMKSMARADYNNAQQTCVNLEQALSDCLQPAPQKTYTDQFGDPVTPYLDAEAAYKANIVRLQGASSLEKGTLKLTLGRSSSSSSTTLTPIPVNPGGDNTLSLGEQIAGCYVANKNIVYQNYNFIFSPLANKVILIQNSDFTPSSAGLPVSSAVRADADHSFKSGQGSFAVHDTACAQTGGIPDTRPAPGALVLTFPDGCPSEFCTLQSMLSDPALFATPAAWYVPTGTSDGDYPLAGSLSPSSDKLTYPNQNAARTISLNANWNSAISLGVYLWLRRAGPLVNVQSVVNMLNSKFWPPAAQEDESLMIVFTVNTASGEINSSTLDCSTIYATNSDSQLMATSVHSIAVASISRNFDFVLSCNVFQPGKFGGLHGGEPLIDPRLSNPAYQPSFFSASTPKANIGWSTFSWAGPSGGWAYSQWSYFRRPTPAGGDNTVPALAAQPTAPSQGALRSTYTTNGTAVEFALHKCAMLPQYVPWGQ